VVGDSFVIPAILIMLLTRVFVLFLAVLGFGDLQGLLPLELEHSVPVEESAASSETDTAAGKPVAPLLGGLGKWSFKVTTKSARAQQFFDQGIRMVYAFNHAEAVRAFQEAGRLDPTLAMASWGEALALGPNINAPLTADGHTQAFAAIQKAAKLRGNASAKEQALIEALSLRYTANTKADRAPFDKAYADAMKHVAEKFPQDGDVSTLYAAAVMDTMPWNYWEKDGSPRPGTADVIKTLEKVIADHPDQPGAHHFYIHMVEASDNPDRAVRSADVLADLMPGAGHMVHMPSHIYLRVGRYADASASNERAIVADEDYLSQCQAQGMYPVGYYPHNTHFLWYASTYEGRSAQAIEMARKTAEKVPHHVAAHAGAMHDLPIVPLYAYVRFGKWTDILTTPKPADSMDYPLAVYHYARALAFLARNQVDRAKAEAAALDAVAKREAFTTTLKDSPLVSNLAIAARVVRGEIAAETGDFTTALAELREAVKMQDAQSYMEPAYWHYPVRHTLGAVLLQAGKASEAEQVYRDDLARNRENGWALFGLMQSLESQQKSDELSTVAARFRKAWARADVTLTASRF
jgi:tetratricopeptide (TPR) repeat protein